MDSDRKTLFLLLGLLGSFSGTVWSIKTYGVQELCGLTIQLQSPLSGPESSIILRPSMSDAYDEDSECSVGFSRHLPQHKLVWSLSMRQLRPDHLDILKIVYQYGNEVTKEYFANESPYYDPNESKSGIASEYITVTFSTSPGASSSLYFKGFELVVTLAEDAPCGLNQFSCPSTQLCIAEELKCDGYDHCGDMSDHRDCPATTTVTTHFSYPTMPSNNENVKHKRMVLELAIGIPVSIVFLSVCIYLMWRYKCCSNATSSTSTGRTWLGNFFSTNTSSSSHKGGSSKTSSTYVGTMAMGSYSASSSVYVGSSAATCSPAC